MQNIKRVLILSAAIVLVGVIASAQAPPQTKEARGTVSALTETTMTVKVGAQDMTFYIDSQTRLEVRRAARDVQKAQPNDKPRVNDFFEVGQPVLVRYQEEKGRNHALDIERVGSAGSGGGSVKEPARIAEGKVTAVSGTQLTINSGGRDMTFAVTGATDVLAKGASTATKAAGGSGTPLTTFVHSGDMVSVSYQEAGGKMTASEIRVRVAGK
jgi:hypothetical protein